MQYICINDICRADNTDDKIAVFDQFSMYVQGTDIYVNQYLRLNMASEAWTAF